MTVHKHADALENELCNNNCELVRRIDACNNLNQELSERLMDGFQNIDTKIDGFLINDLWEAVSGMSVTNQCVKDLQQCVGSIQECLSDFKSVYASFQENLFTPLLGNVDANSICLNQLTKDVVNVNEDVWAVSQRMHKMGQTISTLEKGLDFAKKKDLTSLQKEFNSFKTRLSDFIRLSQQMGLFGPHGQSDGDDTQVSPKVDLYADLELRLSELQTLVGRLDGRTENVEVQCRQFTVHEQVKWMMIFVVMLV